MSDFVTQTEFAKRCGKSRKTINRAVKNGELSVTQLGQIITWDRTNRLYFDKCCQIILANGGRPGDGTMGSYPNMSSRADNSRPQVSPKYVPGQDRIKDEETAAKKRGRPPGKKKPKPNLKIVPPQEGADNLPYDEGKLNEALDVSTQKKKLEVQRLKAVIAEKMITIREKRGMLASAEVYDDAFFSCLQLAVTKFMMLPESVIDDIIALVEDLGQEARPQIMAMMSNRINSILENVRSLWLAKISHMRDEIRKGAGRSNASGG